MSGRLRRGTAAIITLAIVAGPLACGCASARKSFQMSSDSPMPMFGLDFTLPPKFLRGSSEPLGPPDATFSELRRGDGASPSTGASARR